MASIPSSPNGILSNLLERQKPAMSVRMIAAQCRRLYTRRAGRGCVVDSGGFPLTFKHVSATIVDAYADCSVVGRDAHA